MLGEMKAAVMVVVMGRVFWGVAGRAGEAVAVGAATALQVKAEENAERAGAATAAAHQVGATARVGRAARVVKAAELVAVEA